MRTDSGLKKNRTKIQMVLTALVILSVVRQFFLGNYHNMFLGILTLILFMVPQFLDRKLSVTIPPGLETVILIFIFSAEILGEINAFYVKIPIWDTILHTTNGFLMAAIGFALIDLFNRSDRFSIKMSPYFVAFFAFCFSMTVGVMWEFFEFSMDWFFGMDMQKDWIVPAINSVKLNPTGANVPIHVDVQSLVVNGETWNLGGYLDIGISYPDTLLHTINDRFSLTRNNDPDLISIFMTMVIHLVTRIQRHFDGYRFTVNINDLKTAPRLLSKHHTMIQSTHKRFNVGALFLIRYKNSLR